LGNNPNIPIHNDIYEASSFNESADLFASDMTASRRTVASRAELGLYAEAKDESNDAQYIGAAGSSSRCANPCSVSSLTDKAGLMI
jgi:hypothetical protein